jgi:hypothetical protein
MLLLIEIPPLSVSFISAMIAYASAGAKVRSLTRFTAFRQIVFERDKDLPAILLRKSTTKKRRARRKNQKNLRALRFFVVDFYSFPTLDSVVAFIFQRP